MDKQELEDLIKRISTYKDFYVLEPQNNVACLGVPPELIEDFHKHIQDFVDKHKDVTVSNRHWDLVSFSTRRSS